MLGIVIPFEDGYIYDLVVKKTTTQKPKMFNVGETKININTGEILKELFLIVFVLIICAGLKYIFNKKVKKNATKLVQRVDRVIDENPV